ELPVLRRDRRLVLAGDRHEGREVRAFAEKTFGELETDAGRSRIRVDTVVEQPETMILADTLVLLTDLRHLPQFKRDAQRVERRTPHRSIGIGARDNDQALGLLDAVTGALIGDVGGGRCALEQEATLAIV